MSLFFNPQRKAVVSFQLQEAIAAVASSSPEATFEEIISVACEMVGRKLKNRDEAVRIAERVSARAKPTEEQEPSDTSSPGLGTDLLRWMQQMPTDQLCLIASGYDYERARQLYCDIDYEDAQAILSLKCDETWRQLRAQFEAVLYGFGGKLKGDDHAGGETIVKKVDMQDHGQVMDMINEMKAMGF